MFFVSFFCGSLTFGWPLDAQSSIQQPTSTNQNRSGRFSRNINTECTLTHTLLSHYETQQHPQMNDSQSDPQLNPFPLRPDEEDGPGGYKGTPTVWVCTCRRGDTTAESSNDDNIWKGYYFRITAKKYSKSQQNKHLFAPKPLLNIRI